MVDPRTFLVILDLLSSEKRPLSCISGRATWVPSIINSNVNCQASNIVSPKSEGNGGGFVVQEGALQGILTVVPQKKICPDAPHQ